MGEVQVINAYQLNLVPRTVSLTVSFILIVIQFTFIPPSSEFPKLRTERLLFRTQILV